MYKDKELEEIWKISKEEFKIQQIPGEWKWLISNTVNKWKEPKNIFEIGCYDGGSSYYLSKFANEMITIDNNDPIRFDSLQHKNNCKVDYTYLAGDSHDPKIFNQVTKYDWDFCFIDGDHSYEGVKADFQNILPYLKKGTPVAFHDIVISDFHHQHGCYVGEFWKDLKQQKDKFTNMAEYSLSEEWGGIGVVWI